MKATRRTNHETEIKLPVRDARAARSMLRAAGFRVSRRRVFESNTVFDTPGMALRTSGQLLRIREAGNRVTLTYKGKAGFIKHKSREEVEVAVSNASQAATIVARLGFVPLFRYEKFRTELEQLGRHGIITIDETPIGVYLELEGTPHWIDRTARTLGFHQKDYITASYARLYLEQCAREGSEPSDLVFASSQPSYTAKSQVLTPNLRRAPEAAR